MKIDFNRIGRLLSGPQKGWYVKTVDDREGATGGLYLYISETIDGGGTLYDEWFETIDHLDNYFNQTPIEWLSNDE